MPWVVTILACFLKCMSLAGTTILEMVQYCTGLSNESGCQRSDLPDLGLGVSEGSGGEFLIIYHAELLVREYGPKIILCV